VGPAKKLGSWAGGRIARPGPNGAWCGAAKADAPSGIAIVTENGLTARVPDEDEAKLTCQG